MTVLIKRIDVIAIAKDMQPIIDEASALGFGFIRRLWSDWETGANKFDGEAERFVGLFEHGRLTGVGGLNRDPFTTEQGVGRLRHVYLLQARRRLGFGRMLVEYLVRGAGPEFTKIRLRTSSEAASAFYENLGFTRIAEESATHVRPVDQSFGNA